MAEGEEFQCGFGHGQDPLARFVCATMNSQYYPVLETTDEEGQSKRHVGFDWCYVCKQLAVKDSKTGKIKTQNCQQCKQVAYCSIKCQKAHWPFHKDFCKSVAAQEKDKSKGQEKKSKPVKNACPEGTKCENKFCSRPALNQFPCPSCGQVWYCSKYHELIYGQNYHVQDCKAFAALHSASPVVDQKEDVDMMASPQPTQEEEKKKKKTTLPSSSFVKQQTSEKENDQEQKLLPDIFTVTESHYNIMLNWVLHRCLIEHVHRNPLWLFSVILKAYEFSRKQKAPNENLFIVPFYPFHYHQEPSFPSVWVKTELFKSVQESFFRSDMMPLVPESRDLPHDACVMPRITFLCGIMTKEASYAYPVFLQRIHPPDKSLIKFFNLVSDHDYNNPKFQTPTVVCTTVEELTKTTSEWSWHIDALCSRMKCLRETMKGPMPRMHMVKCEGDAEYTCDARVYCSPTCQTEDKEIHQFMDGCPDTAKTDPMLARIILERHILRIRNQTRQRRKDRLEKQKQERQEKEDRQKKMDKDRRRHEREAAAQRRLAQAAAKDASVVVSSS